MQGSIKKIARGILFSSAVALLLPDFYGCKQRSKNNGTLNSAMKDSAAKASIDLGWQSILNPSNGYFPAAVWVFPPMQSGGNVTVAVPAQEDGPGNEKGHGAMLLQIPSSSPTGGLQEAVNYAADYGWDLFVLGGTRYGGSEITLREPLRFPALQGRTIRFHSVKLTYVGRDLAPFIFDSTMMVDFMFDGELIARSPHAAVFSPKKPHPLDQYLSGGNSFGIVDSRFVFTDVSSILEPLLFDASKTTGGVDSVFYVNGVSSSNLSSKYKITGWTPAVSYTNMFLSERPIIRPPLSSSGKVADPFFPEDFVIVLPPSGRLGSSTTLPEGRARVFVPLQVENGCRAHTAGALEAVDVSEVSVSAAIQKGLDFAGIHECNVAVFGRGLQQKFVVSLEKYPTNGFFDISSPLVFRALNRRTVQIYNVTFNVPPNIEAMALQGGEGLFFEFTGQIVAPNTESTGIHIVPPPEGGLRGSHIYLGHILGGENGVGVWIDGRKGAIVNNTIRMSEVLVAKVGVRVEGKVRRNIILGQHLHGLGAKNAGVGVLVAAADASTGEVIDNAFTIGHNPDGATTEAVLKVLGGCGNDFYLRTTGKQAETGAWMQQQMGSKNDLMFCRVGAKNPVKPSGYPVRTEVGCRWLVTLPDWWTGTQARPVRESCF